MSVADLNELAIDDGAERRGFIGRFHAGAILHSLRVAANTSRHVLLQGESGAGKELAAAALHELWRELGRGDRFQAQNAACFAGEDDAVASLHGVSKGAYTGVVHRDGALVDAEGGTLFLDEVHNLPLRAQRSLLRFTEDGLLQPLGGRASTRALDVRLVFGMNIPVDDACARGMMAPDLVARLHRLTIPPLRERRADIPELFLHMVRQELSATPDAFEMVFETLAADAELVERLCLHDYRRGNVRELQEAAAVVSARVKAGDTPAQALRRTFDEHLLDPDFEETTLPATAIPTSIVSMVNEAPAVPRSLYERHRDEIIEAYSQVDDNLTQLERALRERGLKCNRRWLAVYLAKWGVRALRR